MQQPRFHRKKLKSPMWVTMEVFIRPEVVFSQHINFLKRTLLRRAFQRVLGQIGRSATCFETAPQNWCSEKHKETFRGPPRSGARLGIGIMWGGCGFLENHFKNSIFQKYRDSTTFHADPKSLTNGQYFFKYMFEKCVFESKNRQNMKICKNFAAI